MIQKMYLISVEWDGSRRVLWIKSHGFQRHHINNRRNQHLAAVLEADESTVEQMVCGGSEEQTVGTMQPFIIVRFTPRFYVAADQVRWIADESDPARVFNSSHTLFEEALTNTRADERFPGSIWNLRVQDVPLLDVFPFLLTSKFTLDQRHFHAIIQVRGIEYLGIGAGQTEDDFGESC